MVALVAGDVTVTVLQREMGERERRHRVKIAFGDGVKTYPALGVPLGSGNVGGLMGFPRAFIDLDITDFSNGDAFLYKWDFVNQKIRIYTTSTNAELGAVAVAATTLYAEAYGR